MTKTVGQLRIEELNKCIFEFCAASNTTKIYHPEWMGALPTEKEVRMLKLTVENTANFHNGVGLESKLDHVCCNGNFNSVEKLLEHAEKVKLNIRKLYPNYF